MLCVCPSSAIFYHVSGVVELQFFTLLVEVPSIEDGQPMGLPTCSSRIADFTTKATSRRVPIFSEKGYPDVGSTEFCLLVEKSSQLHLNLQ